MSSHHNVFPGIPFIESPLFDAELDQAGFDEVERDVAIRLNRDGFAVIDFPDPAIMDRIDRIKARLAPQFGLATDDADHVVLQISGRIQDAWRTDEDVRAIAANPSILAMLSRLYGRQAFPFQTLNFPVGTQQALHTDTVHFSSVPERFMCGVWLAMEDVGPDCGPLAYVRGSHRWPIMNNSMIGRRGWGSEAASAQHPYESAWHAIMETNGAKPETLQARKGQALIWCANLLHGGSARVDPRLTRWSQVTHYYFENCIYYTPAFSDEPLGRLQMRRIVNAADGQEVPNRYLDETLPLSTNSAKAPRRWPGKLRASLAARLRGR